jgi:hypothetical protein
MNLEQAYKIYGGHPEYVKAQMQKDHGKGENGCVTGENGKNAVDVCRCNACG